MIGKTPDQDQRDMFNPLLSDLIDMGHEPVLLSRKMDRQYFEKTFASKYYGTGQPAMPVRLMVSGLMLKRLYDLGDEILCEAWKMNPYMQYFCGMAHFEHRFPCDPSDLVHFRKRIGEADHRTDVPPVARFFYCGRCFLSFPSVHSTV